MSVIVARLEQANLWGAQLKGAFLLVARLAQANPRKRASRGADLRGAHLEGSWMGRNSRGLPHRRACLEGAYLGRAQLGGADLSGTTGLSEEQLRDAHGAVATKLPEGITRPVHWPSAARVAPACPPISADQPETGEAALFRGAPHRSVQAAFPHTAPTLGG